jgi:hypothetical protein
MHSLIKSLLETFFLKSRLHWTLNTNLHMNNEVSDTDSSEKLVNYVGWTDFSSPGPKEVLSSFCICHL